MSTETDCLAEWCAAERWCAVACTAEVLGRKWHPVIVSELLQGGARGFARLRDDVPGLSDAVLASSLDDLEAKGVVERHIRSDRPLRVEYSLTTRGEALAPVIDAMEEWGERALAADAL